MIFKKTYFKRMTEEQIGILKYIKNSYSCENVSCPNCPLSQENTNMNIDCITLKKFHIDKIIKLYEEPIKLKLDIKIKDLIKILENCNINEDLKLQITLDNDEITKVKLQNSVYTKCSECGAVGYVDIEIKTNNTKELTYTEETIVCEKCKGDCSIVLEEDNEIYNLYIKED